MSLSPVGFVIVAIDLWQPLAIVVASTGIAPVPLVVANQRAVYAMRLYDCLGTDLHENENDMARPGDITPAFVTNQGSPHIWHLALFVVSFWRL